MNTISDQLNATLEKFRENMPCGYPEVGIPPLAPWNIDHFDANIETDRLRANGFFKNVRIDGLNTFQTRQLHFGIITLRIQFSFLFPAIDVAGFYNLDGEAAGFPFRGSGPFTATAFDVSIVGNARMGVTGGFLEMREFALSILMPRFNFNFEGLVSDEGLTQDFINQVLERLLPELISMHQEAISDAIHDVVMPIGNQILNNLTVQDLLDLLERGEAGEPREPCMPPENLKFNMN